MHQKKINFGVGLGAGILLATLFFQVVAPRYITIRSGSMLIKQDKWTGSSWRLVNNQWKKMMNIDQKWEMIDQTLRLALHIPASGVDTGMALAQLKEKYPVLKSITDKELHDRIKIVYSREILNNLYLKNFIGSGNKSGL